MESCDQLVEVRQTKEPSDEAFIVRCIDGMAHEGMHQGHIWVLGDNKASGKKGFFTTVWWESNLIPNPL